MFADVTCGKEPILVRFDENAYKVVDGMHRAVVAIRDDKKTIAAYVAYSTGPARPQCEAHVVYDLLRSYQRGINTNREDLIAALRFLKNSYANVEPLLRERFSK